MKIVIADTGALLSLGHVGYIDLVEKVFGDFYIVWAVWKELNDYFSIRYWLNLEKQFFRKEKNGIV